MMNAQAKEDNRVIPQKNILSMQCRDDENRKSSDSHNMVNDVSIWNRALTNRLRVLLHTYPLHDLHLGDSRRDPELRHYDSLLLTMKVFDLIIDNAGLDQEVDRNRVEQVLEPLLCAMDANAGLEPDPVRHTCMVDRVLGGLRNDTNRRRPFEVMYIDFNEDGIAIQRKLKFRLVVDHFHPAGGTVLRLSNEAINLYLNALELDIEDAQAAAEAVVQSQLERGRFDEAVQSARNARLQSLRFADKLTKIIRDTRRDVSSVDWRAQVPKLLDEALKHIDTRLATERNILSTAEDRLNVMEPEKEKTSAVAEVVSLIRDCRLRHTELHDQLMQARNVFLDEQARQSFVPDDVIPLPNLLSEILDPVLRFNKRDSLEVLESSFPNFIGAKSPSVLSLADVVTWLLRPRREAPKTDLPVVEPDLTRGEIDITRFDQNVQAQVGKALSQLESHARLSTLLEKLSSQGVPGAVLELITLTFLHAFAPDEEDALPWRVDRIPNTILFINGFFGDDLVLIFTEDDNGSKS